MKGETDDRDALRKLAPGVARKTFTCTCTWNWFLGGAALAGRSDMVTWLLAAGVDANYWGGYLDELRRWCDFPLHVVCAAPQTEARLRCIGDREIWDAVAARQEDPNPRVQIEQSIHESWLPHPGDGSPMVGLRAGGSPLDALESVCRLARAGLARLAALQKVRGLDAAAQAYNDRLAARLATFEELVRHIEDGGGAPGATELPPAIAEVERELSRLAQALGTLDRWRVASAAVDLAGKGPLGFLVMASGLAKEAFAGLARPDAHLLGAFLTGRLPVTVLLGPWLDREERANVAPDDLVWPRDYPRAAAPLFKYAMRYPSALLGRDGDALLGAMLEEGGTVLWRVTRRRVEKLGDVRAWVREGVEVLLSA